uniref:Uncharacterized protein n=1 Tax=Romanomermis culicivorax TaxID=13658 RepID=A0A915KT20_ROMCU
MSKKNFVQLKKYSPGAEEAKRSLIDDSTNVTTCDIAPCSNDFKVECRLSKDLLIEFKLTVIQ